MNSYVTACAGVVCLYSIGFTANGQSTPDFPTRFIAYEANEAPGSDGAEFSLFSGVGAVTGPVINNLGDVAFRATVEGTGVTHANQSGIWGTYNDALHLVAREGNTAAGTDNHTLGEFNSLLNHPVLSDSGLVLYVTQLQNAPDIDISRNQRGLWANRNGQESLVARQGGEVPGVTDAEFSSFWKPIANDLGSFVFKANLQNDVNGQPGLTTANSRGIWADRGNGTELVIRTDSLAPGTSGAVFQGVMDSQQINNLGTVAFNAWLEVGVGDTDETNSLGIWQDKGAGLELVLRGGQPAQSIPGGQFSGFGAIKLNNNGNFAFPARLVTGQGNVDSTNDTGIWHHTPQSTQPIIREGDVAPGTGSATFDQFIFTPVSFNDAGDIALTTSLVQGANGVTDDNDVGIWATRNGELNLVAREGSDAPGTGGADFRNFRTAPLLNNAGDIAFIADLQPNENGVDNSNRLGIWAYSSIHKELMLVARAGDLFDVSPNQDGSDMQTIRTFNIDEGGFNDRGELTYRMVFQNNTEGVFVTTIPSPATLAIALPGVLVVNRRKR